MRRARVLAKLRAGLADRGQRYRGRGRELDVVVADDGDALGDPDPAGRHLLQDAQGEQVVRAEHRGRPPRRGQFGDRGASLLASGHVERWGLDHVQVVAAEPGPLQRPDGALPAIRDLPDAHRPAGEGDPLMLGLQQMRHRDVTTEHVVDRHRALAARG